MRTKNTILALIAAAALLAPAGVAVAHEPGKACTSEGAAAEKNPHCDGDHPDGARTAGHDHDPDRDGVDDLGADADNCPTAFNPNQANGGELPPDDHGNVCDHANDLDGDGGCDVDCDGNVDVDTTPDPNAAGYATDSDGDGEKDVDEDPAPADLALPV